MDLGRILRNLSTDDRTVTLVKKSGDRIEDLAAVIEPGKISVYENSLDVEEGDKVERRLPTDRVESYLILETNYSPGIGSVSGFYELRVQKESAIGKSAPTSVVYNVSGANSRVNVNSNDSSTNVANVETAELFQKMRQAANSISAKEQQLALVERIDSLEQSHGTEEFAERYRDFVSVAADHISLFAPFMPALGQLFGS